MSKSLHGGIVDGFRDGLRDGLWNGLWNGGEAGLRITDGLRSGLWDGIRSVLDVKLSSGIRSELDNLEPKA